MSNHKKSSFVEDNINDIELTLSALDEYELANEVGLVNDSEQMRDHLRGNWKYDFRPEHLLIGVPLDVELPRIDGLEVPREMSSDPDLKALPVVMHSSSREEKDLLTSYSLGASACVVKPLDFSEFLATIKQLGLLWVIINEPPPGHRAHAEKPERGEGC